MPGTLQVPWKLLRIYYPCPSGASTLSIEKTRYVHITRLQGGKGQTHIHQERIFSSYRFPQPLLRIQCAVTRHLILSIKYKLSINLLSTLYLSSGSISCLEEVQLEVNLKNG